MFCLVDQDCDSKWTKIKTSLRSHHQHTSSRLHLARWGQGSGHSGEDSHWRQIFLNISINYIWSAGNRNDTREKIEAIYLLFLRILVSSDAYDGMGDISSRHLSVSRQTLATRALSYHTGQWSPPHCSSVTPDIASFGTEDTNSLEAFFSYSSDCCFLINIIGSLFNVFLMRGKKMSMKLKHETSQKIF